mmetsp:Transcript_15301/g.32277  ORF Transcript_15301/g.32277 Transcript_15301/m.32277 type:complete len:143 (+) Transcript_15301:37-465(+)
MMRASDVKLRLQRFGRKKMPFYRIVSAHKYAPRDGKFHEILGTYNPIPDRYGAKNVTLNVERIKYWLCQGAEPTERVLYLLGRSEIIPPVAQRSSLLEEFRPEPRLRWEQRRAMEAAAAAQTTLVADSGAGPPEPMDQEKRE